MEHLYIADTNLFFECKRLEDLPWGELGADPIVVAITKPVQAEIDRHKKVGARTRKRALEVFGRVRAMLEDGVMETVIRDAMPRVVLRMLIHARPDPDHTDTLDYTLADDRIVGIVSTMSKSDDYVSVALMTDDGGAAMTASGLGLAYHLIDQSWKREAEVSEKDKQIADLNKDIAAYRAQEPVMEVGHVADAEVATHVVRRVPNALTCANIDTMVERLELAHPIVTDFSFPEARIEEDGTEISYIAPNATDVTNYTANVYPSWTTQCRTDLQRLHEGREERERPVSVTFKLRNTGTRPASKLRISFEAQGDIFLIRRTEDSEEVDRPPNSLVVTRLPKPPQAPKAEKVVRRPTKPQPSHATDLAKLATSAGAGLRIGDLGLTMPGSTFNQLATASSALSELHQTGVLSELARQQSAIQEALGLRGSLENMSNILGWPNVDTVVSPIRRDLSDILISRPFIPPKHDPEGFYFDDWKPNLPVKSGALTCDLFRHQATEQTFNLEVLFPKEGDVKGSVLCRVQAENLTKPVEARISVSRIIEYFDLTEFAEELVDAVGA